MHNVRRYFREGQIYFLTLATHNRTPVLVPNIDLWWKAYDAQQQRNPFTQIAWVILPDHLHLIVDPGTHAPSKLVTRLKLSFSNMLLKRLCMRSGRVWHNRYWDHVIRDQTDFNRHLDYIHYNPVKHRLVSSASEYLHSSFREYVQAGFYREDWGCGDNVALGESFGE